MDNKMIYIDHKTIPNAEKVFGKPSNIKIKAEPLVLNCRVCGARFEDDSEAYYKHRFKCV